jgi:hypothetical protein
VFVIVGLGMGVSVGVIVGVSVGSGVSEGGMVNVAVGTMAVIVAKISAETAVSVACVSGPRIKLHASAGRLNKMVKKIKLFFMICPPLKTNLS